MVVIIEGSEWPRILAKINEVLSPKQTRFIFDYEQNFPAFLDQISQYNIFSAQRSAYILKNAHFLGDASIFKEQTKFLAHWIPIWESDDQSYFFTTPKLLKNQKIKQILADVQVISLEQITEKNKASFIEEQLKLTKLALTESQKKILINYLPPNAIWIMTEIEKLKNYSSLDNLAQILYPTGETDFFQLWKNILAQKMKLAVPQWEQLFGGNDSMPFIAVLAGQMLNSYLVRRRLDTGKTSKEIAQEDQINPYFLSLEIPLLNNWTSAELKTLIVELFKTEILIKLKNTDQSMMLKFFLLKFCFKGNDV